jgi:hypothetical protein
MPQATLPRLPFVAPPAPRGRSGRKAGGYAANGMKVTILGDWIEEVIAANFGCVSLLDGKRQGAFDLRCGDLVFELKACSVESTEYKMKPKKSELRGKRKAARATGLTACSMIAVVDGGTVHLYWREGLGAFRLTWEWHYAGTVKVRRPRKERP